MNEPEAALAAQVVAALSVRGETLATAESLTAGLVASSVAEVPGASAVLRGGVVAYANDVKTGVLGVDPDIVAHHAVVSAECAADMARAARALLGADWGVATTGVAGPDTTEGKPVGTVFIGIADGSGSRAFPLQLSGGRDAIRRAAARHALTLLAESASPSPLPSEAPEGSRSTGEGSA